MFGEIAIWLLKGESASSSIMLRVSHDSMMPLSIEALTIELNCSVINLLSLGIEGVCRAIRVCMNVFCFCVGSRFTISWNPGENVMLDKAARKSSRDIVVLPVKVSGSCEGLSESDVFVELGMRAVGPGLSCKSPRKFIQLVTGWLRTGLSSGGGENDGGIR